MKLTKPEIEKVIAVCEEAIRTLNVSKTHCHKVMMLELMELITKAQVKIAGLEKPCYSFKIKLVHYEVLLYLRNELHLKVALHSNEVYDLLEMNLKK